MVPSGMPYRAVASHSLHFTLDRWWSYLDFATARTSGASETAPVFKAFCTALRSIPARRFDLATARLAVAVDVADKPKTTSIFKM